MQARQVLGCLCSLILLASTCAAPLTEKKTKEKTVATVTKRSAGEVDDQEKQLENLVSLAGNAANAPNVAVHESHVTHYENKNGKEVKAEVTEEKVTNTETGKVLSDVKQEVKQTGNDADGHPGTLVKTKVDIPAKGIHKTFMENADNNDETGFQTGSAVQPSVEFTPTAVAEYLIKTWDFDNFYAALEDLVNSSIMSREEAERYEDQVIREYQRLVDEANSFDSSLVSQDSFPGYYPTGYDLADVPVKKSGDIELPEAVYNYGPDLESYPQEPYDFERQQMIQEALAENQPTLDADFESLLEKWWTNAFQSGNVRAQALVRYLYGLVSTDNNPDDIGQIRVILADMLANALYEDVSNGNAEFEQEQPEVDGNDFTEHQEQTQELTGEQAAPVPSTEETSSESAEEGNEKETDAANDSSEMDVKETGSDAPAKKQVKDPMETVKRSAKTSK